MNVEETPNDENVPISEKLNQTKISIANSLTNVNDEYSSQTKSNEEDNLSSAGRVAKWATGFDKLLDDPIGLEIFTVFLKYLIFL